MGENVRILAGSWLLATDPGNKGREERWFEAARPEAKEAPVPAGLRAPPSCAPRASSTCAPICPGRNPQVLQRENDPAGYDAIPGPD